MSAATFAIFCFTCFALMDTTDGNYMTLSSSEATVGQAVTLKCAYIGNYNASTIKFYFNLNSIGLEIHISSCSYLQITGYNTTLYDKTCGVNEVSLTIKSVTQADIGTTWECDASFLLTGPSTNPTKASTIIKAKSSSGSGGTTGLNGGAIAGIVIACVYVTVRVILIELHLMRTNLVGFIFVRICDQVLSDNKRILIASIIPVGGEVILFCNLYYLYQERGLSKKEWTLIIASIILVVGVVILFYLLYKLYTERAGTQTQPNRAISKVTPEPNDKKKSPTPNGRGDKLPPIGAETQNLVEAKMKKKKQKKNGENTLENESFEKTIVS